MKTERVTLAADFYPEEGRHYRPGTHVLSAEHAVQARHQGLVEDERRSSPGRGVGGRFAPASAATKAPAKSSAAKKPAARKAASKRK